MVALCRGASKKGTRTSRESAPILTYSSWSMTSSLVRFTPVNPLMRVEYLATTASSHPQRRLRPVLQIDHDEERMKARFLSRLDILDAIICASLPIRLFMFFHRSTAIDLRDADFESGGLEMKTDVGLLRIHWALPSAACVGQLCEGQSGKRGKVDWRRLIQAVPYNSKRSRAGPCTHQWGMGHHQHE